VQPFFVAGLMAFIQFRMRQLYVARPELALLMLTKNLSVLLISFSMLSVIHIVPRNVAIEKTTGLIETLFTTPLRLRDLVWGKALQIGALGYGMGMLLGIINSGVLLAIVGDVTILARVAWYYWGFAFLAAPIIVVGFLNLVVVVSLAMSDSRVGIVTFTMFSSLLVFLGSAYQSPFVEATLMISLLALGVACHIAWWLCGNKIAVERLIAS